MMLIKLIYERMALKGEKENDRNHERNANYVFKNYFI